ncbi:MAG: hypothetical protein ND866_01955, partial [Pyrinomonadaceae bacterium]|nr:hypothetical protein [Pyrinomonadaceae bacterium]
LQCISQEPVNWGTDELLIDCFSLFTPKNSLWIRPNNVIENKDFMREAVLIKQQSLLYTLNSFQSSKLDVQNLSRKPGNEKTQSAGMALGNRFEAWVKSWRKLG